MSNNEIEFLELAKAELLNKPTKKYGPWKKEEKDSKIIYERICINSGEKEIITTSEIDIDIENTIKKQNKGTELTNFFCKSKEEDLTNENILFFLSKTVKYQPYLDIDKITEKIISIKKDYETHDNYEENLIYNAVISLQKLREIPTQLLEAINEYTKILENNITEPQKAK